MSYLWFFTTGLRFHGHSRLKLTVGQLARKSKFGKIWQYSWSVSIFRTFPKIILESWQLWINASRKACEWACMSDIEKGDASFQHCRLFDCLYSLAFVKEVYLWEYSCTTKSVDAREVWCGWGNVDLWKCLKIRFGYLWVGGWLRLCAVRTHVRAYVQYKVKCVRARARVCDGRGEQDCGLRNANLWKVSLPAWLRFKV